MTSIDPSTPHIERLAQAIDDLKSTLLTELKAKDPGWWRVVQLILPVVLTSLLGLVVWNFQSNIQRSLDEKASRLQAQLGVTQHLYEQRLTAYKELYDKAWEVHLSIQDVKTNASKATLARKHLHDSLKALSVVQNANKIIASRELNDILLNAWLDIIKNDTEAGDAALVSQVADQMRSDLLVDRLGPEKVLTTGQGR
ncbi:MAG TPA: hypothetical protein VEK05_15140 [Burkholderiales bacterium]|nr:hypothetical protein [Burkholderiales bacterium]